MKQGGLILSMTKPDFKTISLQEFRKYLKVNRHDSTAWDIYYKRMDEESTRISFPRPHSLEDIQNSIDSNQQLKAKFES